MRSKLLPLAASLLMLTACDHDMSTFTPAKAPANWNTPATPSVTSDAAKAMQQQWWQLFNDETLNQLIKTALDNNYDLKIMAARIDQAKSARRIIAADIYPTVDLGASAARQNQSITSTVGSGKVVNVFTAGLQTTWEADIFGRINNNVQAADADIAATIADRDGVTVSLLAEVATEYMGYRYWQEQWNIANGSYLSQRRSRLLMSKMVEAGLKDQIDLAKTEAYLSTLDAEKVEAKKQQYQSELRLENLLGLYPGSLDRLLITPTPLPQFDGKVILSTPAEVITMRPDIRAAEYRIAAASNRVESAQAEQYPTFVLSAVLGSRSLTFGDLFDSASKNWQLLGSVAQPLLDFGHISGNINLAKAQREELIESYRQTITTSFVEVESSLDALWKESAKEDVLAASAKDNQKALDLSTIRYEQGVYSYLDVLDAERTLYTTKTQYTLAKLAKLNQAINFYRAIGGGFMQSAKIQEPQS